MHEILHIFGLCGEKHLSILMFFTDSTLFGMLDNAFKIFKLKILR